MARYKYLDPRVAGRLKPVKLVARGVVEGFMTGLHKSPYLGFSTEFAEHREYASGDDLRHLDWRLFARTDRYYVKVFEEETNVRCYILLDVSGSMGYSGSRSGGLNKLQYACHLAGALAYLMVKQRDPVGLVAFADRIERFLAPRASTQHLGLILEELEKISAGGRTGIGETFHALAERMKKRSLVIILSDLMEEAEHLRQAIHHFRHRKHEVLIFHILDADEHDLPLNRLVDFVDMETGRRMQVDAAYIRQTYKQAISGFVKSVRRLAAEAACPYVPADTSTPYDILLARYLAVRMKA